MSQAASLQREAPRVRRSSFRFRVRGVLVIAGVCVFTFGALWVAMEVFARRVFANSASNIWSCFVPGGQSSGIRAIPDSVCLEKMPESPLIEYRFNACGHRSEAGCGPKLPGSLRLVLVGSSFTMGYQVAYDRSFAVLIGRKLAAATGRKVEIDNQGMLFGTPRRTSLYFEEALNAHPDLIVWTLQPWDLQNVSQTQDVLPLARVDREGGPPPPKLLRFFNAFREQGVLPVVRGSRSVLMIRHMLYQSRTQYLRSYALEGDDAGVFARRPSPQWEKRWADLDAIAQDMAGRAHASGVPFVMTAVPDLAGALMASGSDWPDQLDPFTFGDHIQRIAQRCNAVYLDVLRSFRNVPHIDRLYYTVDGHMNAAGHAWIAPVMADSLTAARLDLRGR